MAEEAELEGGEAPEGLEPANPAAISIALGRRTTPDATAVDEEAAAFLRDQRLAVIAGAVIAIAFAAMAWSFVRTRLSARGRR